MSVAATARRFVPAGADWIAGLSIAGLLLPEAVAYSGIAGAPPQAGVIALFAGLLVYGLMGSSRFAIVSSTSSSAAVLLAASSSILHVSSDHRALMGMAMVLVAGVMFVLAGLARDRDRSAVQPAEADGAKLEEPRRLGRCTAD